VEEGDPASLKLPAALRRRAVERGDAPEIEKKLQIDALDIYGLSEVIGPGVASECLEEKHGPPHLRGPFPSRDHRSRDEERRFRTRDRRSSSPR